MTRACTIVRQLHAACAGPLGIVDAKGSWEAGEVRGIRASATAELVRIGVLVPPFAVRDAAAGGCARLGGQEQAMHVAMVEHPQQRMFSSGPPQAPDSCPSSALSSSMAAQRSPSPGLRDFGGTHRSAFPAHSALLFGVVMP